MAGISNYLENKLIDHSLGTASYTMPTTVYLALYTTDPTDANSGTEVSGSGYSRQAVTFSAASSGSTTNSSAESFTASGGSFGSVGYWGVLDASTSGNLLWYGALTNGAQTVTDGQSLTFVVSSITLTAD